MAAIEAITREGADMADAPDDAGNEHAAGDEADRPAGADEAELGDARSPRWRREEAGAGPAARRP